MNHPQSNHYSGFACDFPPGLTLEQINSFEAQLRRYRESVKELRQAFESFGHNLRHHMPTLRQMAEWHSAYRALYAYQQEQDRSLVLKMQKWSHRRGRRKG